MSAVCVILMCLIALAIAATAVPAASEDLGKGFAHHGVATPVSNHRGIVATKDGEGRDIALAWLMDHRGCYELLLIDAETGKAEEFPITEPTGGDSPFASILSSDNKFYTHFGSHFYEFDPVARKFTFTHKTAPQMAMAMTEDDNGVIWSASYPKSGVVSFNPKTREFKDYGHVYNQDWPQYQRYMAADDKGWVYFGIGNTESQIIALDPATGKATPLLKDAERAHGNASVIRDMNGKVYGFSAGPSGVWMELYEGQRKDLPAKPALKVKPIIAASQSLFHQQFPSGKLLKELDTVEKYMIVTDPKTKEDTRLTFDYTSEGAHIMGMCAAPDGSMCGGSAFPMRFFSYQPKTDTWVNQAAFLQFNTVAMQGDRWYTGGYGHGFLLEWDPTQPWKNTKKGEDSNPLWLADSAPDINRPHDLLAHPDGKTLVLAGTPGYGLTGGGLLFWDRETKQAQVIKHTEILPEHSTMSLVALDRGKILGGSTIDPGTGGATKASLAELYIMDMATRQVEWHAPLLKDAKRYTDMCLAPNGLVYGFADWKRFFVFSPKTRTIVYEKELSEELGTTNSQQGPRTFVTTPDGSIYILLRKGIAELNKRTLEIKMVAESPIPVGAGGDYLDGRIYFASGSHVYSWKVK
ncbi:MAG: NHL repeat-containing protein [Armatimonadota bacterium]